MAVIPDWTEEVLLAAMRSVAGPQSCCYVAGPLTSSAAKLRGSGRKSHAKVESRNRLRMQEVSKDLRSRLPYPVIDSSVLHVPEWTGSDYSRFFLRVIEEMCFEIRFVNDWQFSMGATKEFIRAHELGIPCFDEDGSAITLSTGAMLLQKVLEEISSRRVDDPGYMRRLVSLRKMLQEKRC